MEKIIPISKVQKQICKLVRELAVGGEPVLITQKSEAQAVLLSREQYEGLLATVEEMSYPDWKERLERAKQESATGARVPHKKIKAKYLKK